MASKPERSVASTARRTATARNVDWTAAEATARGAVPTASCATTKGCACPCEPDCEGRVCGDDGCGGPLWRWLRGRGILLEGDLPARAARADADEKRLGPRRRARHLLPLRLRLRHLGPPRETGEPLERASCRERVAVRLLPDLPVRRARSHRRGRSAHLGKRPGRLRLLRHADAVRHPVRERSGGRAGPGGAANSLRGVHERDGRVVDLHPRRRRPNGGRLRRRRLRRRRTRWRAGRDRQLRLR